MTSGSSPSSSSTSTAQAPASCRGRHLICELYGADRLDEVEHVTRALEQAARSCGATVLDTRLHPFEEHGGVTGVVLLAESHVTIHTWPEHDYAAVDVFLCGDCAPEEAIPILEDAFLPDTVQQATFERGRPSK
jgi:S-adenosylmethionine decarboxylase